MRVAVYYSNNDIRLEERPTPVIGPGEILLRTEACGICGSDTLEWYRKDRAPLILGHEVAGTIVEIGRGVRHYKIWDRVAVSHHVPCNTCHYCLNDNHTVCETLRTTNFDPGGFSEYIRLPSINVDRGVYKLPDSVSFEEATFIEPIACVLRGHRKIQLKKGQSLLILGCGISGLLNLLAAKALGLHPIMMTDIDEYRMEKARTLGADVILSASEEVPQKVRHSNNGRGADRVILTTGAPSAIEQALASVDRAGVILFFAPIKDNTPFPLPINDIFWRHEGTLTSTYAAAPDDHREALEMMTERKIDPSSLITHQLKLDETQKGFQLTAKPDRSLKVIIKPHLH